MDNWFAYIIYPLLFFTLYFEVFLVLSFFDREARRRRGFLVLSSFPTVSIIIPCYNEEKTVAASVDSVLALEYPKERLSLILVDDGSTDGTVAVMERYRDNPQVRFIRKENGGKYTALNAGLALCDSELVGCLDADSIVTPKALALAIAHFDEEKVGAVTSSLSVNAPRTMLERMQEAEYLLGITLRHTLAVWNGLYVTPGPFTIYRKKIFDELGHFRPAHNTEDMEIALRLQKHGWRIGNAPAAGVYTNAPDTVRALIAQRMRWTTGFLRNIVDYRELVGNPAHGVLGLLVLPFALASVFAAIVLFGVSLVRFSQWGWEFATRVSEVPLSFTFALRTPEWFFIPVSSILLLSAVVLALIVLFIFVGALIARKKTDLGLSLVWYFIVYSIIASWWRLRAVADVALGIRRSWR